MSETGSVGPFDAPPVPKWHTSQSQPPETEEPAETAVPADAAAKPPQKVGIVRQVARHTRHKGDAATEKPPSSPATPPPLSAFMTPTPQRARQARTPNQKLTIEEQPPAPKRPWAIAWVCLVVAIVIVLLGVLTIASGDENRGTASLTKVVPPETLADDSTCQAILRPGNFPESEGKFGAVCGGAVYRVGSSEKEGRMYVHKELVLLPDVVPPAPTAP